METESQPIVSVQVEVSKAAPQAGSMTDAKKIAAAESISTDGGDLKSSDATTEPELHLPEDGLIQLAEKHFRTDRLLEAARVLRSVDDKRLLSDQHREIILKAETFEKTVVTLTSPPSEGWTKQGESHGHRDTIIYYRLDGQGMARLTARIETPIEQSLLVPLLSVFNETELYKSWMPRFEKPFKLGVSKSVQLQQNGRANQIVAVTSDMPWPLNAREAILEAHAIDDIDANGHIVVKMVSRETDEKDGLIPPPEKGVVRIDFDGGILFRRCPSDHSALKKSKRETVHNEPLVLVCLTMCVDPHVTFVPQSVINWTTRHVIGRMWAELLEVAEEVRDGKRPEHAAVINEKREFLYDWVDQRVGVMLSTPSTT